MHLHFHVNLGGAGDGREEVKLGDGQLLKTLIQWAPFIAGLFGVKLPPLPNFTSEEARENVVG
ncbi:MAG TPA: hypothetical protein VGE74_12745 [Gemmata sp.]